jgi:hypothetical protein
MKVTMQDAMLLDEKSVRRTADGYLTAFARAGRTGIQIYKGSEVGKPEMDEVRVYRPPEEVFSHDTLHSLAHRPLTMDHPRGGVNSKNWKEVSIGATGAEVVRDGEFIRVPLVVMDAGAIRRVEDGHKELSWGYSTELKWGQGLTTDGQPYDAVQTAIRGNHLAVVTAARGGPELKIGDANNGEVKMRTVMVDGIPVEVQDGPGAGLITKSLSDKEVSIKTLTDRLAVADKAVADSAAALAAAKAEGKAALDTKDGEIAVLKKAVEDGKAKFGPAEIDKLVADRLVVLGKAKTIAGDKLVTDGKTDAEVRREVVTLKLGDAVAKPMSDDAIAGAFAAMTVDTKANTQDGTRRLAQNLGTGTQQVADAREQAYEEHGKWLRDAWKGPQPANGRTQ